MSTLSLSDWSRFAPIKSKTENSQVIQTRLSIWTRLSQAWERRRQIEFERRVAVAIAAQGGLLTDDLERRLMVGDRL